MRQIRIFLVIIMTCFTYSIYGQQGRPSSGSNNTAEETQPNAATEVTTRSDSAQVVASASDTTATGSSTAGPAASNTPAIHQTTSSQSGSPAMLSDDQGSGRDGTNNVQKASMNMAGSPVKNLDIDDRRTVDADTEMQDRQEYTQEKQLSAQDQAQGMNAGDSSATETSAENKNTNANSGTQGNDKVSDDAGKTKKTKKKG